MLCWDADMPDDVARAYAIWDGPAAGNVSETARLLGKRRPTVQDWSQRYRWQERRAQQRAEDRDRTIADAYARMVGLVDGALETVEAAIASRLGADGKPEPGTPTPVALRAAFTTLGVFRIAPAKAVDHTVTRAGMSPTLVSPRRSGPCEMVDIPASRRGGEHCCPSRSAARLRPAPPRRPAYP